MNSNSASSAGDTQPVSQWVYESKEQASTRLGPPHIHEEEETGHINLLDGFEQEVGEEADAATLVEDDEEDGVDLLSQDIRAEIFPESQRFHQPKTPLAHGTKRKRPSQEKVSQMDTPRLPVNPFADFNANDMMRPSQIFGATQAQTSPHIIMSDGLYERPSPNVNNLERPSTAGSLSSPAMVRGVLSSMARVVTEPQDVYVSMKESQEARERRLREMRIEQDYLSEDEFGPPSHSQPQRRIERDRVSRGARIQLAGKSRPPLPSQMSNSGSGFLLQNSKSSRRLGKQASEAVLISDDALGEENQENVSEDETEREEEKEEKSYDDEIDELAEDNKENVEVPMTVSRHHHAHVAMSQMSPSRNHVRRRTRTPGAQPATQVRGSPRAVRSPKNSAESDKASQPYAVRDSQSSQQHGSRDRPTTRSSLGPHLSQESRKVVLQSQLSQKSRGSVPPSTIPKISTESEVIIQLTSSSPPHLSGSQSRASNARNVRYTGTLNSGRGGDLSVATTTEGVPQSKLQKGTEDVSVVKARSSQELESEVPVLATNTIPETSSTVREMAHKRMIIPNSSQDMSSSGPVPSSASKAATNHSTNGHSLGTTMFETAASHLSQSPSKNHTQILRKKSQGSNASSPSRNIRLRTLGEIAADQSPPAPEQGVPDLLDFGILSKDDMDFQNTVRKPIHSEPATKARRSYVSTKWKATASGPPSDYGTPVGPTSSAMSAPTPIPVSAVQGPNSSPLSPPPDSQHNEMAMLTPAATRIFPESSSPVQETPVDKPSLTISVPTQSPETRHFVKESAALAARESGRQVLSRTRSKSGTIEQASPRVDHYTSHQTPLAPPSAQGLNSNLPVVAPDRVFAHFNGRQSAFYAATCTGVIAGEEPRYLVRYDDGAEGSISAFGIKRLEFQLGDVVKVDLPTHRTKNYVVIGMQDKQEVQDPDTLARRRKADPLDRTAWPEVDIHGFARVLLSPKQREPVNGNRRENEQIAVDMYHLYLTQAMWTNIKDRGYTHISRHSKASAELQTPSDRPSTPSSPASRAKRVKTSALTQSASLSDPNQGLFRNMVFSLTNIYQPNDLERTKSFILTHGGRILENGFDSLFHVPILHHITSPKKSDLDRDFHLARHAESLGFTCLIADKHCRRAKYIQALALGIPCLATRWISDCVLKQRILPWSAYLLPAGESAFLNGAVRSRVLPSFSAETATLSHIVEQRPRMLEGASILLIMPKSDEETMRQHPLLTFALGPARVARALSVEAAAKAVAEAQAVGEPWDWVFSYDKEKEVERVLFGSAAKKRKSRAGEGGQEQKTKVVGNEFVIQSLILGQLVDG